MEYQNYLLDITQDYRITLAGFVINKKGDLFAREGSRLKLLISHNNLSDSDIVSDLLADHHNNIGAYLSAYFCACEVAGIKQLNIRLYGWRSTFRIEGDKE